MAPRTLSHRVYGDRLFTPLLLTLLTIPPLCIWAITQPRSIFYSPRLEARYFVPFAAPALVLAAAAVARAARRHRAALALAPLLLAPSLALLPGYYAPRRATDTLPTMALAIWSQAEPGDAVLLVSGNRYPLWLYHYDRQWVQPLGTPRYEFPADAPPRWEDRPPVVLFPDRGSDALASHDDWQAKLDGIVDAHKRVWLVEYGRDLQDPQDEVEAWLAGRLERVLSEGYGADALHLFAKDGRAPVVTRLSARWPGTAWSGFGLPSARSVDARITGEVVHPLVGASAHRARAGDVVNSVIFARANTNKSELGFQPACVQQIALNAGPGGPILDARQVEAQSPPIGRRRASIDVTEHTVGGRVVLVTDVRCPSRRMHFAEHVRVLAPPLRLDSFPPASDFHWFPLLGDFFHPSIHFDGPGGKAVLDRVGAQSNRRQWLRGWLTRNSKLVVATGDQLIVDLRWRKQPRGGDPPSVFVHLVGGQRPDGSTIWGGHDGPLNAIASLDRHVLTVDSTAPPGHYQIEIGLYDPVTGERYNVSCGTLYAECEPNRVLFDVRVRSPQR